MSNHDELGSSKLSKNEEKLLRLLTKQSPMALSAVTESLDLSSHEVFDVGTRLRDKGYLVGIHDEGEDKVFLSLEREEDIQTDTIPISDVSGKFRVAFLSELRLGARQEQLSLLHWLYKEVFVKEKVDFVVIAGGIVVGKPTLSIAPDVFKLEPESQAQHVIDHFPVSNRMKTYVIAGRRELSFKSGGFDIVSAITSKRKDLVAAGELERTFELKGMRIKVMSPWDDNSPISKSYGPQKIADNLSDTPMPDILVLGSMHFDSELPAYMQGAPVYTIPSFHTPMRRQKRRGVSPDIGCLILELSLTKNGKLERNGGIRAHHIPLGNYAQSDDYRARTTDISKKNLTADAKKVLAWLDREDLSHGTLSRRLKKSRKTIDAILSMLRENGFKIVERRDSKLVCLEPSEKTTYRPLKLKYEDVFIHRITEGHVSDTHYGSKEELPSIVRRAYHDANEAGVEIMFHAGDVTEGAGAVGYRGHANDVKMSRMDEQIAHAAAEWPREVKSDGSILETDVVSGNHDEWGENAVGICPVWVLANILPEHINYLGSQFGTTVRNGIFHQLKHPAGGLGFTRSVKVDKHMRALKNSRENEGRPSVVALGHWHVAYLRVCDMVGLLVPCFKDSDTFHGKLALVPAIGMWILEIYTDKKGNITRVVSDYRDYQALLNQINRRKKAKALRKKN